MEMDMGSLSKAREGVQEESQEIGESLALELIVPFRSGFEHPRALPFALLNFGRFIVSNSTSSTLLSSRRVSRFVHYGVEGLRARAHLFFSSLLETVLFTLASPLISPKFFRKLVYTSTLSALATHLPIQQLLIPAETLKFVLLFFLSPSSSRRSF